MILNSTKRYDFDAKIDRRNTNCEKWDEMKLGFGSNDLLPFWVADMDFRSPPEIIEVLREQVDLGVFGYPIMREEAYKSVVDWEQNRHGWTVAPEDVGFVPGIVTGLAAAVCEFTSPGDGVVVQTPVYPPFFKVVRENGRVLVENRLKETPDG
jgi:cystathionine beta-lyase